MSPPSFKEKVLAVQEALRGLNPGFQTAPEFADIFSANTALQLADGLLPEEQGDLWFLRAWNPSLPSEGVVNILKPLLTPKGWDQVMWKAASKGPSAFFEEAWLHSSDDARLKAMPTLGWEAPFYNLRWAMFQGDPLPQDYLLEALGSAVKRMRDEKIDLLLRNIEEPWLVVPRIEKSFPARSDEAQPSLRILDKHWAALVNKGEAALPPSPRVGLRFRKNLPEISVLVSQLSKSKQLNRRLPKATPAVPKPRF